VAVLDSDSEGSNVGDLEFEAALLTQLAGGGLVAQVREALDEQARHLLSVVAVEVRGGGQELVRGAIRGIRWVVVVFWLEVHSGSLVGGLCLWRRRTARTLGGQQCSHGSGRVDVCHGVCGRSQLCVGSRVSVADC